MALYERAHLLPNFVAVICQKLGVRQSLVAYLLSPFDSVP